MCSGVLLSNAPAFFEHDSVIPNKILQEQSGNRRHAYGAEASQSWRCSPSMPTENLCSHLNGQLFTGGLQLYSEKTEEWITKESKRLIKILHSCEKYQKYRERQDTNSKDKEPKEQKWPDNLELAFFRGMNEILQCENYRLRFQPWCDGRLWGVEK